MDCESQKPGLALWEHEDISGDITRLLFFYNQINLSPGAA